MSAKEKFNLWGNIWRVLEKDTNRNQQHSPGCHPQTCKVQEKISMGWWQLPEIAHCSCATLRSTSNPVLETEPFAQSSVEATQCRNHCWMLILPKKVTPDQDKHCSTTVVRQMGLHCCHFHQAGKGLQWEKGMQSSSPANMLINNYWLWWWLPERPEIV